MIDILVVLDRLVLEEHAAKEDRLDVRVVPFRPAAR